ncbi:hypothetical protein DRE_01462 [Drechslerella stenobrocha 248]|uniref:Uncharacterized protein n=1 Tax=Drechslerella stenobrocha 248 TaxID=1043628 RepID=W7I4D1_9PEZI|nr:hypothetical protein DRE_01462 [Drechslerella stenobrocha 248]
MSSSQPRRENWEVQDPNVLYLYVSLSTGAFSNYTKMSRIETILKSNKIPFKAIDVATDEKARSLWTRRRRADQTLPALVKDGLVLGDLQEVEEWNEYGELISKLGPGNALPSALPQNATSSTVDKKPEDKQAVASTSTAAPSNAALAAAEAAAVAKQKKEAAAAEATAAAKQK